MINTIDIAVSLMHRNALPSKRELLARAAKETRRPPPAERQTMKAPIKQTFQVDGQTKTVVVCQAIGVAFVSNSGRFVDPIPTALLSLVAGKDAWMRNILLTCADCGEAHKASEMEGDICRDCYEQAAEENVVGI